MNVEWHRCQTKCYFMGPIGLLYNNKFVWLFDWLCIGYFPYSDPLNILLPSLKLKLTVYQNPHEGATGRAYSYFHYICVYACMYRGSKKRCQSPLKSTTFHGMSWKYGFYIIRGREFEYEIWFQTSQLQVRLKNRKMAKNQFVRFSFFFKIS